MTIIACALEQFRLAHGHYPESLSSLQPVFLPHVPIDPVTSKPYIYERLEDGADYALRSAGFNQTDDNGEIVFRSNDTSKQDFDHGDWVWPRPATE